MFQFESEMSAIVERWLCRQSLHVKRELITPWGECDFVAVGFDEASVSKRISLGQSKAVTSLSRSVLLMSVPDAETQKSKTLRALVKQFAPAMCEASISKEVERLVTDGFLVRTKRGGLQKLNGWMPLHKRIVTVELKLNRIEEVMQQAKANLSLGAESYVALPHDVAKRIQRNPKRWSEYFSLGIGLLSVTHSSCRRLVKASPSESSVDRAVQLHAVEKFWGAKSKATKHKRLSD